MHVVLFHALFTFSRASVLLPPGAGRALLGSGYVSVGLFFVLSGFVLAYSYVEVGGMATSAARFWRARVARVYPMHLLGLALAVPLFVLGSLSSGAPPAAVVREGGFETLLSATLVQAWVPAHALDLNGPAWSLSAEAFFYLAFPLLVRLLAPLRVRWLVVVAGGAWLLAVAAPLVHGGPATELARRTTGDLVLLYDPLLHLPDFVIGLAAGLIFLRTEKTKTLWAQGPMVGAAAAVAVLAALAQSERIPFGLLHNGLLDPLFAVLVFALATRGGEARGLGKDALVRGGGASYALYVLHKPLYFWGARLFHVGNVPPNNFLGGFVAVSVVVALLAWRTLEEPARAWIVGKKPQGNPARA
jgi:peptidoglycan/LPS O-acetylase OafA/YrhL